MQQHHAPLVPDRDKDFYAWTQHQAKLLRALDERQANLPDGLDLPHIAEEIYDMGGAQLNAARSYVRQVLIHLIKAAAEPEAQALRHWRTETAGFAAEVNDRYLPSMRQNIEIDDLWSTARKLARLGLQEHGRDLPVDLPEQCPFSAAEIAANEFDFDGALAKLRG